MSALRPTLGQGSDFPVVTNGTAYLMIYNAVKTQPGLLHGKLKSGTGDYCAIGSFFKVNTKVALYESLVDEVAAFNDSMPNFSKRARQRAVLKWLRWKLAAVDMPGFKKKAK